MPLTVADLEQYLKSPTPAGAMSNLRTFYSPIDDVHGALKAVLGAVQHSVVLAMYGFDDDELAEMLDEYLKNPNIYVQISLDKSQAGGVHEKAILDKYKAEYEGNSVAIGTSEKSAIMHRKMVIVDGIIRISGSTNWSDSGESKQDNEATVLFDAIECTRARTVLDIEHHKMLKQMGRDTSAS